MPSTLRLRIGARVSSGRWQAVNRQQLHAAYGNQVIEPNNVAGSTFDIGIRLHRYKREPSPPSLPRCPFPPLLLPPPDYPPQGYPEL